MSSIQSRAFILGMRLLRCKEREDWRVLSGGLINCPEPPRSVKKKCRISASQVQGHRVFKLEPQTGIARKHVLYLHGGAYMNTFARPHWSFLARLANEGGCTVTAPDYPLAPRFRYEQTVAMTAEVYSHLTRTVRPQELVLMGDSAGGGLALAVAQLIRNEGLPVAGHIILLSPWLDLTNGNEERKVLEPLDPFLGPERLEAAARAYAGDADRGGYLLSPVYGQLTGLGRISVFYGTRDILAADARLLKRRLEEQGAEGEFFEYQDMVHAWMFMGFPESRKAVRQILRLLSS